MKFPWCTRRSRLSKLPAIYTCTGSSANLYQPPEAFFPETKKCSFTSKNLLTSVWVVYVLQSVGASPGKLADATGAAQGCRFIRPIGSTHEFYAAKTRSYISNRVGP